MHMQQLHKTEYHYLNEVPDSDSRVKSAHREILSLAIYLDISVHQNLLDSIIYTMYRWENFEFWGSWFGSYSEYSLYSIFTNASKHTRQIQMVVMRLMMKMAAMTIMMAGPDIGQASALYPIASLLSYWDSRSGETTMQQRFCIPHSFVLTSSGCHLVVSMQSASLLTYIPELCRILHRNNKGTLHPNYISNASFCITMHLAWGCFI
jgi:hypothetical protein